MEDGKRARAAVRPAQQETMTSKRNKVLAEYRRFEAQLPDLLELHRGKWVVFRDDAVHSVHDSEDPAMRSAVEAFGLNGGFVVARVEEIKDVPLTAAVMFGHQQPPV